MKFLVFVFLLLCLSGTASAVDIPAGYVSGYILNSPGTTYELTGDILAPTTAFSVASNDIVFDGNGHTIDCGLNGAGVGITSDSYHNITIKNLRVIQHNSSISSHDILIKNTANSLIINCSASGIAGSGVYFSGYNTRVDNCRTTSFNGTPLYIFAYNSSIKNCSAVSNSNYSLYFINSYNNIVSNCTGLTNSSSGIAFLTSNNNKVSNCEGYSNLSNGLSFTKCNNNTVLASTGHTNASVEGYGISLNDSSNNTFVNSSGLSYLAHGIKLIGNTKYNTFINCVGESFGQDSLRHGIWFSFSSAACSGTNTFSNFSSRSTLATTIKDPSRVTYLNIGDSITTGGHSGPPYGAYIHYTNMTLGNSNVFYSRGLGGETAESGRIRFLDELAVFNPEYVTIMYGANDLKDKRAQQSIIDDILWMASQAEAHGAKPIILLTPTRKGLEKNTTYLDQNLSSQALAAGYNVFNVYDIIDTVPNNLKYDEYNATNYLDSVHPTQAANKLIGEAFAKYITGLNSQESVRPSADFSSNVSSGYVPLWVQFTNLFKNAT